ncbi:MAG: acyl carrier protein [Clostridia bacterium]|nr:acyl carrier protein [Clostridia bacterium]
MQSIEDKVINIISNNVLNKEIVIDKNTNLVQDLALDSIVFIQIILDIETEFEIEFPDELLTMDSLSSLNTIVSIIKNII